MIALALAALSLTAQDPPPAVLVAPAGFAVDLVDSAPHLRWPSAVFCRADGSLLVAEDPMDMPGPTDQPLDRVWLYRFGPDGSFTRTLFAEKLFASFGLEEIDGAVYVMNMPHLTLLRDVDGDGVAEQRKELLTDLGPVAPGIVGGFNDHIISGLRFGTDGWLYVACGDKGVPLAHGTDGSKLTLRGGGVIRLRPDGSKLEIVARGLRNILDVAIDANGEMFTYDNTDDGLGWWTRLTHIVPGGYYGYPWDYHDHPERFLAPLADYGGGSPTGGLVKREGGWPAPYEGSLFFCEWGDQTLRRFQLERDGGTFKVVAMEEFLQPGEVKDFHPTDVAESPDGRFLFVSDWGFGGWTAKDETGRLWRVRRADEQARAPRAAVTQLAKPAKSDPPSLDDADLMTRQYALAEFVRAADKSWAPDADLRLKLWSVAKQSPIAMHHWRALAASRMASANFAHFFEDGDPQSIEMLDAVADVAVRMAETRRGALEDDPPRGPFEDLEACGILALARGEKGGSHSPVRVKALRTLGVVARVCEPWDGKWWSIAPAKLTHPARTIDWRGTEPANAALRQALTDPDDAIRKAALAAVVDAADARLLSDVRQRVIDEKIPDLRKDALEALGRLGSEEDGPLFARISLQSQDLPERLSAMRIGARLAPQAMWQSALALANDDTTPPELRAASLELLSQIDPSKSEAPSAVFELAVKCSTSSAPVVRRASCKLLTRMDAESSLPILLALDRDSDVHTAAFEALATQADPRAARAFAQGLCDQDPEVRSAARRVIAREKLVLRPALEGMAQRQEFSGAVVRELRALYAGHQPILEWEVRGPCPVDELRGKLDFSKEHASESLRSLDSIQPVHAVSSRDDGMIDLRKLLTDKSNQAAYAFGVIESPTERDVELHVGSDDQVKVWLDGELVHEFDGARAFSAEADHFKAHLQAGKNSLALRIGQVGGDWSFALTVPEVGSGPLFESKLPAQPSIAEYAAYASEHAGDPAKGALVLKDINRTTCLRCHAVAGAGEHVGPDLGGLGARYSRSEIVNSILSPSQRILDGYAAVSVLTKDDQLLFGQVKQDDANGIVLVDATGTPVTIARADVAVVRPSKLSVMPEGLCNTMTLAEFADLVACLGRR